MAQRKKKKLIPNPIFTCTNKGKKQQQDPLFLVPIIDLHGADQLIGIIREDQRVVSIAPHISIVAETGPVCKYELTTSSGVDLPFEAEVIDKEEGRAIVRVKDKAVIDCSHSEFRVQVAAVRCDDESARSERFV